MLKTDNRQRSQVEGVAPDAATAPLRPVLDELEVSAGVLQNWQATVDLLAKIANVPAALIMRVHPEEIEVLLASHGPGNVYHPGERASLNTGLYCEMVMSTRHELQVPNALKDPLWDRNPDIALGMISYCGLPLAWPNGEIFGTICILDREERQHDLPTRQVLERFADSITLSLALIYESNTAVKQARAAIADREKELREFVDAIPIPVLRKDAKSRWLLGNRALFETIGKTADACLGRSDLEIHGDPAVGTAMMENDRRVMESGAAEVIVEEIPTPTGLRTFQATRVPLRDAEGRVSGIVGAAVDITQRKASELALTEALRKLENHVASSPLAIIEWDPDYRIKAWNPRAEEMFGWSATEALGKRIDELPWVPEEDLPSVRAVSDDMTTGARPSNVNANRNRRKDGRIIHCEWNNTALHDEAGKLVSVLSMVEDVTARVEAVAQLRASEGKLALFVEHAPAAIAMFDREMRYLATSRRWLVDYGLGDRDVIGHSHYEIFPDLPERWRHVHQRCLAGAVERMERDPFPRADGSVDWVNWEIHPWRQSTGEIGGLIVITEVITERVELQAKLAMTSRLAAFGTLVGGLAHEINNPLAGAMASEAFAAQGVADVRDQLRSEGPLDRERLARALDDATEALGDAQGACRRIASILKDLRVFGHAETRRTRTRLMDVVESAVRHLPAPFKQQADIRVHDEGAPDVIVASGQMVQVVGNLVMNAVKATRAGERGTVRISVGPGDTGLARIEVTDLGVGIGPEIQGRIFDPFFTTREVGQGMGLGLPVCHAIVTEHGGTLTVKSEVGKGSTFRVELPVAPAEA